MPAWYPATHNRVRPRYCANRPPTPTKDQPVSPPTSEEAMVDRDPQVARAAAAGFADSSGMGWIAGRPLLYG